PVCGGSSPEGNDVTLCTPYSTKALANWSKARYPDLKSPAVQVAVERVRVPLPDRARLQAMVACKTKYQGDDSFLRDCLAKGALKEGPPGARGVRPGAGGTPARPAPKFFARRKTPKVAAGRPPRPPVWRKKAPPPQSPAVPQRGDQVKLSPPRHNASGA